MWSFCCKTSIKVYNLYGKLTHLKSQLLATNKMKTFENVIEVQKYIQNCSNNLASRMKHFIRAIAATTI